MVRCWWRISELWRGRQAIRQRVGWLERNPVEGRDEADPGHVQLVELRVIRDKEVDSAVRCTGQLDCVGISDVVGGSE
jgi:hypothetical protein